MTWCIIDFSEIVPPFTLRRRDRVANRAVASARDLADRRFKISRRIVPERCCCSHCSQSS